MPGSHVNLSDANMILNTAVAKSLKEFADAMDGSSGEEFEAKAIAYIKKTLSDHQRIVFNGNGYSEEWPVEAQRRGLANHKTTADALPCFIEQKSIDLFAEFDILSETEVHSRYEVKLEKYNKLINIEARVMKRMARRTYLPAINRYASEVAASVVAFKEAVVGAETGAQEELLADLLGGIKEINVQLKALDDACATVEALEDELAKAKYNAHELLPIMEGLRAAVDAMEIITDRNHWPVPSYNNMLFYV